MTNANADPGVVTPEIYRDKPVFFRTDTAGAALYAMIEYRAGNGREPMPGDQLVLSIMGPEYQSKQGEKWVTQPSWPVLEGVFEIIEVQDGLIESPFLAPAGDPSQSYWGVTVTKVGEIETEDQIERLENAGVVALV